MFSLYLIFCNISYTKKKFNRPIFILRQKGKQNRFLAMLLTPFTPKIFGEGSVYFTFFYNDCTTDLHFVVVVVVVDILRGCILNQKGIDRICWVKLRPRCVALLT